MMARLGFASRVIMILLLGVFAVTALAVGWTVLVADRELAGNVERGVPARIAAIVKVLDKTPASQRRDVLAAVATPDLAVRVSSEPERPRAGEVRRPGVVWLLRQYFDTPAKRNVIVRHRSAFRNRPIARWLDIRSPGSRSELDVSVRLASGAFAIFTVKGAVQTRIFGIAPGFWIGVLGALFAILTIAAVMREARPLRDLQKSMRGFAQDAIPRPVPPRGARDLADVMEASNAMQARIGQLIAGRTIMIGAVTHDLKTFLTRLRLRVESHPDFNVRQKAVHDVEAMDALVDDAVAFAAAAAPVSADERVSIQTAIDAELAARESEKAVCVSRIGADVLVRGRDLSVRRVINNLVDNALRYGERAKLHVSCDMKFCSLHVDDAGPGIPHEARAIVFEPFARLEPSRNRESGGAGLGLAISRQIVEAAGGSIEIATAPTGGARFTVKFLRA